MSDLRQLYEDQDLGSTPSAPSMPDESYAPSQTALQDDQELDQLVQRHAALANTPQAIGAPQDQPTGGEDQIIPPAPPAGAAPAAPPKTGNSRWDNAISFGDNLEQPPAEQDQGIGSELVGGLARSGAQMVQEGGGLLATAMRKTGKWTDTKWLQEGADAIDNFDDQLKKSADEKYSLGTMSMKDAWDKGVIMPWIAGKATEQALPMVTLLGMARLSPILPIAYGALVGANEESKKPDSTPASISTGAAMGAASMGLPIGVAHVAAGQDGWIGKLVTGALGFGGIGAAQTFEEPAQRMVRGGAWQGPLAGEVAQGAVVGGLAAPLALMGGREPPKGAVAEGAAASGADPAAAAAVTQALGGEAVPPEQVPPAAGFGPEQPPPNARPVPPGAPPGTDQPMTPPAFPRPAPPEAPSEAPPANPLRARQAPMDANTLPDQFTVPGGPEPAPTTPRPEAPAQQSTAVEPAEAAALHAAMVQPELPALPSAMAMPDQTARTPVVPPQPPDQQLSPATLPNQSQVPRTTVEPTQAQLPPPAVAARQLAPEAPPAPAAPDRTNVGPVTLPSQSEIPPVVEPRGPNRLVAQTVERARQQAQPAAPPETPPSPETVQPATGTPRELPVVQGTEIAPGGETGVPTGTAAEQTPAQQRRAAQRERMKPAARAVLEQAEQPRAAAPPETPPGLMSLRRRVAEKTAPTEEAAPARETPTQRAARIRAETQVEFAEAGEAPASSRAPVRGQEDMGEVATSQAERAPTRTRQVKTRAEAEAEAARAGTAAEEQVASEPVEATSELKSEQRAASTTDKRLHARDLLDDVLAGRMSVGQAHDAYGEPSGGRPREFPTFMDFLNNRIKQAGDPKALARLSREAQRNDRNRSLTSEQRLAEADRIGKEYERLFNDQERLPQMLKERGRLENDLRVRAQRAAREGRAAPSPPPTGGAARRPVTEDASEAALRAMEEANKKDTLGSPDDEVGAMMRGGLVNTVEMDRGVNKPLRDRAASGETHDLHDYLDDLIGNPAARARTPHLVEAARMLKRTLDRGVQVEGQRGLGRAAEYDPDRDVITLSPDAASHARAIVHEGLHAGTVHFLRDVGDRIRASLPVTPPERRVYDGLGAVAREVDRVRRSTVTLPEGRAADYALSERDHEELVTQALTDPHLAGLLARTQASPTLLRDLKRLGLAPQGRPSVWDAFKDIIRRVFRASPDRVSAFDAALRPLTEAVEAGGAYRRQAIGEMEGMQRYGSPAQRAVRSEQGVGDRARLTDATPGDLPQRLSEFGDHVQTFDRGGVLGSPDEVKTRARLWDRLKTYTGEGARPLREGALASATTNEIVNYNRDVLPQAERIIKARAAMTNDTGAKIDRQWGDRVQAWAHRLKAAGDDFEQLRNDASMAQASLGRPDFDAANAHLNADQLAVARGLQARFDALPPEQQELYRDLRDYHNETGWAMRQAAFEHAIDLGLGDKGLTDAERAELGRVARSRPKLDQLIKDPDSSDLARLMADRWDVGTRGMAREIAKMQRTGWIEGDYTPLQRHGDYIVSFGEPGEDSYGVRFFERRGEANAFRDQFRQDNPGTEVSPVKVKTTTGSQRYREFLPQGSLPELEAALARRGITGDDADRVLDAYTGMMLTHATQSQAARYSMARRNVKGASTEGMKNLLSDFAAYRNRMGYLIHGDEERRAYNDAELHVRNLGKARLQGTSEEIAASATRLAEAEAKHAAGDPAYPQAELEDLRQQHEWLQHPPTGEQVQRARAVLDELKARQTPIDGDNTSRWMGRAAKRFTGASFVLHLVRPAHLAVQQFDAMSNGTAFLGARHGYGRATATLMKNMLQLAPTGARSGMRNMVDALHGELKQSSWVLSDVLEKRLVARGMPADQAQRLIAAANDQGMIDVSRSRELQRMAREPGSFAFGGEGVSHVASNMMDLFASAEHALDATNRVALLKTAFDLEMRQNGGNVDQAISEATRQANRAMPNYNIWNKPRIATERGPFQSPLVSAAFQYKIYGMHLYSVMGSLVKQAATRGGAERAEAIKALAGLVATHSLLVGLTANMFGVPVNALTGAWDLLRGKPGPHDYEADLRRWMTSALGPSASTFLSRGALGLAGIDLHRSLKVSNMLDLPEIKTFDREGVASAIATALTGASGEVAEQLTQATHDMMTGNFKRGVLGLAPRVVGDIARARQMTTQGLTDSRGNVIVPAAKLSPASAALRAIGFNPMETATIYDRRAAEEQWEKEINDARAKAEDAFVQNRDLSKVRAYNADRAFNQGYVISMQDLQSAVKRQQGRLAVPGTYGLQVPKKRLPGALAAGRFS